MDLKNTVIKLSNANAIANNYKDIYENLSLILNNKNVEVDKNGNIFVHITKNNNAKNRVLLDAHMDEIGFVVHYITDEGFLKISKVGGVDKRVILSSKITVLSSQNLTGVVSCSAPHLQKEDKYIEVEDCFVDLGLSASKVKELVNIGDFCTFKASAFSLLNNQIAGKAMDNRAGCAALCAVTDKISKKNFKNTDICILFSVKEELPNSIGAQTFAFKYKPTHALVVDTSFAFDSGAKIHESGKIKGGTMVGISPILERQMYTDIINIAKNKKIAYQKEVLSGLTGTNADAIAKSHDGVKTALLSIPIKNMHSQSEIVCIEDIESTIDLVLSYLEVVDNA